MATAFLLRVHVGVYLLGALVLAAVAFPVAAQDGLALASISWPLLLIPVVVVAGIGGLLEGLAFRTGYRGLGWSVLAVAAVLGAAAPLFFVGRWPGETAADPTDPGALVAAELGWAGFVVLITAIALAVGRR